MKLLRQVPAALLLLLSVACHPKSQEYKVADTSHANTDRVYKSEEDQLQELKSAADSTMAPQDNKNSPPRQPGKSTPYENWDKKIIKTATITLEVKNYKTFNDLLRAGVKETGGYVAGEEQTQSDYKIENVVIIKVPVDRLTTPSRGLHLPVKRWWRKRLIRRMSAPKWWIPGREWKRKKE